MNAMNNVNYLSYRYTKEGVVSNMQIRVHDTGNIHCGPFY